MLTGSELKRAVVLPDARQRQQRVKLIGCSVTVRGPPGGEAVRGKGGSGCGKKNWASPGAALQVETGEMHPGFKRNQELLGRVAGRQILTRQQMLCRSAGRDRGNMLGGQGFNWESTLVHVFVSLGAKKW